MAQSSVQLRAIGLLEISTSIKDRLSVTSENTSINFLMLDSRLKKNKIIVDKNIQN